MHHHTTYEWLPVSYVTPYLNITYNVHLYKNFKVETLRRNVVTWRSLVQNVTVHYNNCIRVVPGSGLERVHVTGQCVVCVGCIVKRPGRLETAVLQTVWVRWLISLLLIYSYFSEPLKRVFQGRGVRITMVGGG